MCWWIRGLTWVMMDKANTDNILARKRVSSWQRFRRNKGAWISLLVLAGIVLVCVVTLPVSSRYYQDQDLSFSRKPPQIIVNNTVSDQKSGTANSVSSPESQGSDYFWQHFSLFGYDTLGRNLLWRCLYGGVVSLGIGISAAVISVIIGCLWGMLAGWYGGKIGNIMMRTVDILYGLPYILLVILFKIGFEPQLVRILGPGRERAANIIILFVAIGGVSWLTMARVIRGQVLSLKARPFMESARALGVPAYRIMLRHLLPNLIGPVIVYATLTVPQAILQESFLSFLGIGIQAPVPTWGSLAAESVKTVNTVQSFWWMVFFPCALLGITLLCLNFIGDGLRDALDPKSRK